MYEYIDMLLFGFMKMYEYIHAVLFRFVSIYEYSHINIFFNQWQPECVAEKSTKKNPPQAEFFSRFARFALWLRSASPFGKTPSLTCQLNRPILNCKQGGS